MLKSWDQEAPPELLQELNRLLTQPDPVERLRFMVYFYRLIGYCPLRQLLNKLLDRPLTLEQRDYVLSRLAKMDERLRLKQEQPPP